MTILPVMLAIEITQIGAPEGLKPVQRDLPIPDAGQVLIQVAAAGVNRPDVMQRKGLYPPPIGASDIPGLEVAGKVVAVGADVNNLNVGDSVCALVNGGGYAEYCLATAAVCLPIPAGFSYLQAAALPETFFTVWSCVFDRAKLLPNETILIHGGSSGIGTAAIQLCKAFGATVIVTAGSDAKCARCLALGADAAINYNTQGFVKEVNEFTHNQGVNVILDMVGGDYFARNVQCMAADGRLVQIALQNGPKAELNLLPFLLKRLTLTGATLRPRDDAFKAAIAQKLRQQVWPLLALGSIKPVIACSFALQDAAKAHHFMESSQHIGKIMLTIPGMDANWVPGLGGVRPSLPASSMPSSFNTLVSAEVLDQQLNNPHWVVLDARFTLGKPEAGAKAYRLGHIPGARYVDLDKDLASRITSQTGRHPLPDFRVLMEKLGQWGIHNDTQVVVYDDVRGAMAGRLWWLLKCLGHQRVAILDGGFSYWQKRQLPVTTTLPSLKPTRFKGSVNRLAWVSAAQVQDYLAQKKACLIDARAAERFNGIQEPIDPVAGHIPGAINRPFQDNLDAEGLFLPPSQLREQFGLLLKSTSPSDVIHMCGSGVTACHNLLAMEYAGLTGSLLYAGSWSEWIRNKNRPVG